MSALRTTYNAEYLAGGGLLLSRLRKLAPGLDEFFGQLLDPAFRRRIIVGGRSCHYYTPFPLHLPVYETCTWSRVAQVS
jgi:hypothetical protein